MDLSNENVIHIKKQNIEYLQFRRLLEYKEELAHAFTIGIKNDFRVPVSSHILTNEQIEKNKNSYRGLCNSIGIEYKNIVKTNQIHDNKIKEVKYKINNKEPDFNETTYCKTDGLITNKKDLAICATNADCIVLIMYDMNKKVIASVHSGWRGTIKKISTKTIDKMQELYKCNPKDIICCISPSIRICHFEVDEDVKVLFDKNFKEIKNFTTKQEKWHIDTVKINIEMLKESGLKEENIIDSKICTVCNSNLIHSYRGSNRHNGVEIGIVQMK